MKKHTKRTLLLIGLSAVPFLALAQTAPSGFEPLTNLPGVQGIGASATLPSFFNNLYRLCIGAAAVIAVLQIMRAGAYFMFNKGSITQNQQAKELIQNSLLGLLLVLSPAIVFGIINPDILDLKLDISELELGEPDKVNLNESGRVEFDDRCELYVPGDRVAGYQQCSSVGEGYERVSSQCCQGSEAGSTCCARPKSNPEQSASTYMWRVVLSSKASNPSGSGLTFGDTSTNRARSGGPFDTKKECETSYSFFNSVGEGSVAGSVDEVQCDCSKPRSEFPACSQ